MTEQVAHTSLKELTAFSLGQLMGAEAVVVERHVNACDVCCQTLNNLSTTKDTFVQLLIDARRESRNRPVADREADTRDDAEAAAVPSELIDHPRYKVIELVGVGGMGVVYRAQHRLMERMVALKVINRVMVNNPEAVERFHREVKAAARLSHVNIVAAHDAEQVGDVHFLVMEYVEGTDLAKVVTTRGPLPVGEACDYIYQAALGLQHAHEQGMVHRDIKPHNLMLTEENTVKILDFGLASLADVPTDHDTGVAKRSDLTSAGSIMGTPDYISPEQAIDARAVDGRSDIYSLGATFYFLLAGRPPFDAGSVTEVLESHAVLEVTRIDHVRDDVPPELANVIARTMSKDPANRYQTPSALADALAPWVNQHGRKRPATFSGPKPPRSERSTVLPRMLVLALLLTVMALAIVLYVITDKGTVIIDSPHEDVEVVIRQEDGEIIQTIKGPRIFRLPSGDYQISLKDDGDNYTLDKYDFTLTRGSTARVAALRVVPNATPSSADKSLNSMKFTLIPAGDFTMGTPPNQKATPEEWRHVVSLTSPFHIDVVEVTQQEYAWVMGNNPSDFCASGERHQVVADQTTDHFPVENVSWEDATEFCRRLSGLPQAQRANQLYRLPTEAEWELACRAGTTTTFHFGDGLNGTRANVDGKHPWGKPDEGAAVAQTVKTGSYDSNAFGLFDMHGNVWEWCSDWYTPDYYTNSPLINPSGPSSGTSHVVRGGAWNWGAMYARSATREHRAPDYSDHSLGFRVVRVSQNRDAG